MLQECGTDLDQAKQHFTRKYVPLMSSQPCLAIGWVFHSTSDHKETTSSRRRFYDKTLNQWEDRESFVKHPGKYDLLLMDYEAKVWL